ncbi:hypothetical protein GRF29_213g1055551 [Pseudopithomyces chartarum]|uniref:Alpha-methylacyl-CoA racemase n=1 Tax=Pseudopithomyces chartarum TaxID=1892770 RepID=A0AAN6RDG4_9PLEO|nr:hypothetical protein GRF29_213g1055551 [Pseudopithomyces chartarum]
MTDQPPPLAGLRVLEFAGLAPGPFAGMLLADYGASILRLDRPSPTATPTPTSDQLVRRKSSLPLDLKSPSAISLVKKLLPSIDIVIDPFRPGVLEKLGLCPQTIMLGINPRLIVARMTGFRRDGKYSMMAGHDINYIACGVGHDAEAGVEDGGLEGGTRDEYVGWGCAVLRHV